ncbi:CYTH domain-containing protein [Corynebacterium sp. ES2715-CONJ3]|uniref:CYTH domain-containing protein n=1 Tax=Corynebacterium sp. ES2715-CONJ3 TaxID=2974028 RepID=UPI002168C75A|nr:CYTH domain-containing protein [Corynebacterium sp. ES2715-CONJ3]MCS4492397.1 CYTH domain-containing protein [Corynebacterium sp. ES2715-CONJ3]
MVTNNIEREIKFAVSETMPNPPLDQIPGVSDILETRTYNLSAIYFDTEDFLLFKNRITLRYRSGGKDDGWTLKLPGESGRVEIHSTEAYEEGVPRKLTEYVDSITLNQNFIAIARIENERHETVLADTEGKTILEFCDDHVSTERLTPRDKRKNWREWEIELISQKENDLNGRSLLDAAVQTLQSAGARISHSPSKLENALREG